MTYPSIGPLIQRFANHINVVLFDLAAGAQLDFTFPEEMRCKTSTRAEPVNVIRTLLVVDSSYETWGCFHVKIPSTNRARECCHLRAMFNLVKKIKHHR